MKVGLGGPCRWLPTPGHCGQYLRLEDAAATLWRAMETYHRAIVEDDMRSIPLARRHLKRARRRLARARMDGVRYDQVPLPGVRVDGLGSRRLPEVHEERDAHA